MARIPDGFVFVTKASGPKAKDGKVFVDISMDERKLVMCKSCRYYSTEGMVEGFGLCYRRDFETSDEWYCADGEVGKYAPD